MSEQCQVGLLIETSNAYARGLMSGVAAYVRQHVPWDIFLSEGHRGDSSLAWLSHWKGHGLIARI